MCCYITFLQTPRNMMHETKLRHTIRTSKSNIWRRNVSHAAVTLEYILFTNIKLNVHKLLVDLHILSFNASKQKKLNFNLILKRNYFCIWLRSAFIALYCCSQVSSCTNCFKHVFKLYFKLCYVFVLWLKSQFVIHNFLTYMVSSTFLFIRSLTQPVQRFSALWAVMFI
jgi:hypothetical protein